jgi:hypothetical protein
MRNESIGLDNRVCTELLEALKAPDPTEFVKIGVLGPEGLWGGPGRGWILSSK